MAYRIFKRKWWKNNPSYPNGLEPDPTARKTTVRYVDTESEARRLCRQYNDGHDQGRHSTKYEYEGSP